MPRLDRFHLAIEVTDLDRARDFYVGLLGCPQGRCAERWVDFDFFGHQLTAHLVDQSTPPATNAVDGDAVPARHFGLILPRARWEALAERLRALGTPFLIEPRVRFQGRAGEQATLFLRDPAGNALEFKSFPRDAAVFAPSRSNDAP